MKNKNIVTNLFFLGLLFFSTYYLAQKYRIKNDAIYLKNYQVELIADKNYVFFSDEGFVDIPFDSVRNLTKVNIINHDNETAYNLFPEELKFNKEELFFSSGKLIDPIILKKKKEFIIGIDTKGRVTRLYSRTNASKIVEIPNVKNRYNGKKIKKLRFLFTGGNNTLYYVKTAKKDINIIPILFTCNSVDCKDKKNLIPEMEVHFLEKSKFLEVDLSQHDIFIDDEFENLYVGYIALNYFVVKTKKVENIGDNKCYNNFPDLNATRISSHTCPIISVVIE